MLDVLNQMTKAELENLIISEFTLHKQQNTM